MNVLDIRPTAQEGEEYLVKAVEMRPHVAKYHVNLGNSETLRVFLSFITYRVSLLGVIYHLQKRYKQAESCYLTALQLEPGMPSAEDNLRKLHSTLSKLSKEP